VERERIVGPETVVTLIGVAVIVGALALYLIMIAGILVKVSSNLTRIQNEVILDVANKTANVRPVLSAIASNVSTIEQSMASVASSASPPQDYDEEEEEEDDDVSYEETYEEEVVVERPRLRRTRVRR
jgi:predicted PurR-regulated permease PerM